MKKSYPLQGLFILFGWLFFFSCKRESISVPANDTSRPTIAELLLQWKPDVKNDFQTEQLGVSAAGNPISNARKASSFTILNAALAKTGVLNDLKRSGVTYTLFAPDDEAFANSGLTRQEVNKIPKDELAKILRYHILSQKVGSAAIPSAVNPNTQQGNRVFIRKISSNVYVNLAKVIQTDIPASNGILHIIDKVLIPQVKNLKEIVATDPQFSLLAQALNTAKTAAINVDSLLTSEGPNTLFAPSNTAFEQAGLNSDSLAKLEPEEIATLLTYHMTSAAVFSIDILEDIEPLMLSGEHTAITVNGGIRIQGTLNDESVPVTETDRLATNGVIHVITGRILVPSLGSVRDNSGNVYKTIRICNQVWMAENLRTSRYRNNDAIPNVTAANNWLALTTGAWCNYDNAAANDAVYGKLYNSFAIQDTRSLAPRGWHIPSSDEWETLFACLGNKSIAGGKMKAVSNLWLAPNTAATNSSGFTGLPGGLRTNVDGGGGFAKLNSDAWFAFANPTRVGYFNLYYTTESVNNTNLFGYYNWFSQTTGVSVRCVKD